MAAMIAVCGEDVENSYYLPLQIIELTQCYWVEDCSQYKQMTSSNAHSNGKTLKGSSRPVSCMRNNGNFKNVQLLSQFFFYLLDAFTEDLYRSWWKKKVTEAIKRDKIIGFMPATHKGSCITYKN